MSARVSLAACLLAAAFAYPARAAEAPGTDPFGTPVPAQDLGTQRGGTDSGLTVQLNATSQSASNSGNFSVDGPMTNGAVSGNNVTNNSGITTVMTNTGNQANLSNSTNVIVNMR